MRILFDCTTAWVPTATTSLTTKSIARFRIEALTQLTPTAKMIVVVLSLSRVIWVNGPAPSSTADHNTISTAEGTHVQPSSSTGP